MSFERALRACAILARLTGDVLMILVRQCRSRARLELENAFLRKQLSMMVERKVRPRLATDAERIAMAFLAKLAPNWRDALVVARPATVIRWQREVSRRFWRRKCRRGGRPALPRNLRNIIATMADDNPSWGQERVRNELCLKLGIHLSPRTVGRYWPGTGGQGGAPRGDQRWATFVRNHAKAIVACDFVVAMTLNFRIVYVLVVMEIGSRRILQTGVTEHPTAAWTAQQLRDAIPGGGDHKYLIHDRDSIFSAEVDNAAESSGLEAKRTPPRSPKANAFCERLIGTLRRECLDWIIPLSEGHLRMIVREWAAHYNGGRPHMALGPAIPDAPDGFPAARLEHRHVIPAGARVVSTPVLGGLHHEYRLDRAA